MSKTPKNIDHYSQIPFLPVEMFKQHRLSCFEENAEVIFKSSSTGGQGQSAHHVKDLSIYKESSLRAFESNFGKPSEWCILSLLPSYLERGDSSLVQMASWLHEASGHQDSGFFLYDHKKLAEVIRQNEEQGLRSMLLGVSFALLDFAESYQFPLKNTTIIETGGMKGRRKELIREELHLQLKEAWDLEHVASEYGMTETLSQAWSLADGHFKCPAWMRVLIRDHEDPFSWEQQGKTGGINIIDLANIHSCSFLATSDLGRIINSDSQFEVLGRFDNSDIRGCSLMAS